MTFKETTIDALAARVGWGIPVPPAAAPVVTSENATGTGGLTVGGIYPPVTIAALYAILPNPRQSDETFNATLARMRKEAAIKLLNRTFIYQDNDGYRALLARVDADPSAIDAFITKRINAFDDALGWQMAIDAMRVFIVTPRINAQQRALLPAVESLIEDLARIEEYNQSSAMNRLRADLFPVIAKRPRVRFID